MYGVNAVYSPRFIRFFCGLLLSIFSLSCQAIDVPTDIVLVGHFSNLRFDHSDDPHIISGYDVNLYKRNGTFFGVISAGIGAAEPAFAPLDNLQVDEAKHTLSFSARLTEGTEYSKETGPNGREARVLLEFRGRITPRVVAGTFTQKSGYHPAERGISSRMTIKRDGDTYVYPNYASWLEYLESIRPGW